MRLIDYFDRGASRRPDVACFTDGAVARTYAEVAASSHRIAQALIRDGIRPGDVVATLTPNHLRAFEPVLGIARAGAVWLAINARFEIEELRHVLGSNDCRFLFCHSDHAEQAHALLASVPSLVGAVAIDAGSGTMPSLDRWAEGVSDERVDIDRDPDAMAAIRSTGGTTGPSKGVMISHRTYSTVFASLFTALPVLAPPVHLVAAPLSHGAGTICLAMLAMGGRNVVMPRFDAERVLALIEAERISHLFVTPTMLYMLLDCPRIGAFDYSSLRCLLYAGAPISIDKLKRAIDVFGPVLAQAYGQAEAPFFCTILTPAEHLGEDGPGRDARLRSCGRETLYAQVEIMDGEGRLLPPGERGEIVVRGDLVMKGYYRNSEATARVSRFGWHHTGDIGFKDDDGYLFIVDRERDMIISGGFNLYPSEIEQVLWSHEAVKDCAVIGVPDERWGEAVKAIVELREGRAVSEEELVELCRRRLGRMKAPKSVEFWDALPRSPVGKVLKREIRRHYWISADRLV